MAIDFIPYSLPTNPKKPKLDFYLPDHQPVESMPVEPPIDEVGIKYVQTFDGIQTVFEQEQEKLKAEQEKLAQDKLEFEVVKKKVKKSKKNELEQEEVVELKEIGVE